MWCRSTWLSCRKFLGCLLRDTCFSWDRDQCLGRNWFSLFLVLSLSLTQTGNVFLSMDVAFHRSLIQAVSLFWAVSLFRASLVPLSFTPICFLGRVSHSHSLVCTVLSTKGLCSLVVPLGTVVRQIKGYKVCIELFCNLSCTTKCLCQSVWCRDVSNTGWCCVKDSVWFCDLWL